VELVAACSVAALRAESDFPENGILNSRLSVLVPENPFRYSSMLRQRPLLELQPKGGKVSQKPAHDSGFILGSRRFALVVSKF